MLNCGGFFIMEEYNKAPFTYEQQLELLQTRGLKVDSPENAVKFLQHVNYYRFSAYCIPFQNSPNTFSPDITFKKVVDLYRLDDELRNALLVVLSPIEIFFRTRLVYELSHSYGAFAHYEAKMFHSKFDHSDWIMSLEDEATRGKEKFLEHYKTKYLGFPRLPLWMACEIMSMGSLSRLYRGLIPSMQRQICSILEIHHFVFVTWLHVVTYLRNICAHHARLWNRELQIRPQIPNKDIRWTTLGLDNTRLFASIAVAEWICRRSQLDLCNIKPVHKVMRKISLINTNFSAKMGVPVGRAIGMCWDIKE